MQQVKALSANILQTDLENFGIDYTVVRDYLESLERHIAFVRQAAFRVRGIPLQQVIQHDLSKYNMDQFPYYARHFYGDKGDEAGFQRAWRIHCSLEPHHWRYWCFPDHFHPDRGQSSMPEPMEMPAHYVREMVADWMGANMAYQGTWDMTPWLTENLGKIVLHPNSATVLRIVLDQQGYGDLAKNTGLANE